MDNLKRKHVSDSPAQAVTDRDAKTSIGATILIPQLFPKRLKSESGDDPSCCSCETGDVNSGDSPSSSENDADSAHSIGLNPASMSSVMAKSQWRESKSELIGSLLGCSSSMASTAKDGDDDEEDRDNIVGLTPGDGTRIIQGEDDDDNDVNLVLDLLMQKVCLDSW